MAAEGARDAQKIRSEADVKVSRILSEAEAEGIALLTTPLTTYEAAGKLWEAGLRGEDDHE